MDNLYNVKRVVVTEMDPLTGLAKGGVTPIAIKTAENVGIEPVVSKGDEKVQRDDDVILAIARTPDLLYGYTLKLTDNTFSPDFASLAEGAVLRKSGQNIVGFDTPMLSQGNQMKPFIMDVYVANYSGDTIINYLKITFNKCGGNFPNMDLKKDFYSPEFTIDARENTLANKPIKTVDYVSTLPADDATAPTLTMTSVGSITKPAPVIAKSSELGALYLVSSAVVPTNVTQLNTLVTLGIASVVSVTSTGTDTNIATTGLAAGSYKVYAVDTSGNVSAGGTTITLV